MALEDVRWERTDCPACGSTDEDEFLRAPGEGGNEHRLAKCRRCAMVYLNPRPDEASVSYFYPADYAPYQPRELHRRGGLRGLRNRLFGDGGRTLAHRIPATPGGCLLDYGCGSGAFAAEMRDRGWDAFGMDFSPHAAAAARLHYGLRVVEGTLPHPAVPHLSLDAITLRAVLEHVHDPNRLLRAAFDALKPGGWLYVSVPNLASWGFRTFGLAWFPLELPRHLLHFTPDTLRRAVTDCGFAIDTITTRGHAKWMARSLARAKSIRPLWWARVARFRPVCRVLTKWTQWRGRADDLCLLARKPGAVPLRKAA